MAVTSANLSGEPSPVTARDAWRPLGGQVALAVDAGPAPGGVASSVVRVEGEHIEILREGAISGPDLFNVAEG
jgi:tRNA A37 threonylcarbamoyladenosine synthetase subunit TsaC/SUA5/YrdC